jgi:hypothetical protein
MLAWLLRRAPEMRSAFLSPPFSRALRAVPHLSIRALQPSHCARLGIGVQTSFGMDVNSPFRKSLFAFCTSDRFEFFIVLVILANCTFLAVPTTFSPTLSRSCWMWCAAACRSCYRFRACLCLQQERCCVLPVSTQLRFSTLRSVCPVGMLQLDHPKISSATRNVLDVGDFVFTAIFTAELIVKARPPLLPFESLLLRLWCLSLVAACPGCTFA